MRQSTPALVLLAETRQQSLAARWVAQLGRFWNSVLVADEDSLVRRAMADSCALAAEAGSVPLARRSWAGQVAAGFHSMGMVVSLQQPQPVCVSDLVQSAAASFHHQLISAQGTRTRQYVATTGAAETDGKLSLPAYLHAIPQRSRRQALAQLRTGSHWLAEETGRWRQQQRDERLCPHCHAVGEQHIEDAAHAVLFCPRAAALRAQYPGLFDTDGVVSLRAFLDAPDVFMLARFCRALRDLHHL